MAWPTLGQHAIVFFTRTRQFKFANKICPVFVSHRRPLYSQLRCKQLNFCFLKNQPIFLSSKSLQHRINSTRKHITTDSCNCQFLRNHVVLYRPVEQTCKKKQTSNPQHTNSPITITELTVSNRFLFPKSLPMHARKLTDPRISPLWASPLLKSVHCIPVPLAHFTLSAKKKLQTKNIFPSDNAQKTS